MGFIALEVVGETKVPPAPALQLGVMPVLGVERLFTVTIKGVPATAQLFAGLKLKVAFASGKAFTVNVSVAVTVPHSLLMEMVTLCPPKGQLIVGAVAVEAVGGVQPLNVHAKIGFKLFPTV